MDEQLITGERI